MSKTTRAFIAIFWLLMSILMVCGVVFGLVGHDNSGNHMYGISAVCALLGIGTGYFNYHDLMFFLGKGN